MMSLESIYKDETLLSRAGRRRSLPVSMRSCRTRPAGSWRLISTSSRGSTMRWRSWRHAEARVCRAVLERSRSGNGAHVWIFFSEPVLASEARRLGAHLVTETMEHWPDIGFESYDRFFPSQDTMPAGG